MKLNLEKLKHDDEDNVLFASSARKGLAELFFVYVEKKIKCFIVCLSVSEKLLKYLNLILKVCNLKNIFSEEKTRFLQIKLKLVYIGCFLINFNFS